jgi:hypothetical protein
MANPRPATILVLIGGSTSSDLLVEIRATRS